MKQKGLGVVHILIVIIFIAIFMSYIVRNLRSIYNSSSPFWLALAISIGVGCLVGLSPIILTKLGFPSTQWIEFLSFLLLWLMMRLLQFVAHENHHINLAFFLALLVYTMLGIIQGKIRPI